MKNVYVITCERESNKKHTFTLGEVNCVFSSLEKANLQLEKLKDFFLDESVFNKDNGFQSVGRIVRDYKFSENGMNILRDLHIVHPNGKQYIYRITKVRLNDFLIY